MSKHWKPDESVVRPLPRGKRLKSLEEFTPPEWLARMADARRQPLPEGAQAGLVLVAAACLGLAIGMYAAFGPRNAIATGADSRWAEDEASAAEPQEHLRGSQMPEGR